MIRPTTRVALRRGDGTEYGRALEPLSGTGRRRSATTTFVEYAGAMLRTLAVRAACLGTAVALWCFALIWAALEFRERNGQVCCLLLRVLPLAEPDVQL